SSGFQTFGGLIEVFLATFVVTLTVSSRTNRSHVKPNPLWSRRRPSGRRYPLNPHRGSRGSVPEPVQNLLAIPEDDTLALRQPCENLADVEDPVRDSRQVGMECDRHDLCSIEALRVQPFKLVEYALHQQARRVMLERHHHDVVELEVVRQ